MTERAGVIILGSNSTRMLVADIPGLTRPVRGRVETRLFLGMDERQNMADDAIRRAAQSAGQLCSQAREEGAQRIFVLATSAARDARNTADLARAVQEACGCAPWILSGQMEARYAYLGAASAVPGDVGVIDIGGGSTEVVWGTGEDITYAHSFQLGAARLHAQHAIRTPQDIAPALELAAGALGAFPQPIPDKWMLVGGTGAALKDIALRLPAASPTPEEFAFDRALVSEQLNHMASLTPEERLRVTGLPPGREHIFPTGLAVLLAVMDTLGIGQGTVTLRNNTDGFLYAYARGIV